MLWPPPTRKFFSLQSPPPPPHSICRVWPVAKTDHSEIIKRSPMRCYILTRTQLARFDGPRKLWWFHAKWRHARLTGTVAALLLQQRYPLVCQKGASDGWSSFDKKRLWILFFLHTDRTDKFLLAIDDSPRVTSWKSGSDYSSQSRAFAKRWQDKNTRGLGRDLEFLRPHSTNWDQSQH